MTVIKANSTDLAINIANNSRFGLGSAVFGNDKAECAVVAKHLRCGMVRWVCFSHYLQRVDYFTASTTLESSISTNPCPLEVSKQAAMVDSVAKKVSEAFVTPRPSLKTDFSR